MVYLNNPVCNSFYFFPVTCSEIETEISKLKTGTSVGRNSRVLIPVLSNLIRATLIEQNFKYLAMKHVLFEIYFSVLKLSILR